MKSRFAWALVRVGVSLVSVLVTLLMAEGAYRAYLAVNLDDYNPFNYAPNDKPSIGIQGGPGLWRFNADHGWDYNPDGYRSAQIVDGQFSHCGVVKDFNLRGNMASSETDFGSADVRVALVGSSYTMKKIQTRYIHELFGDRLGGRLGKKVLVENYSRDSYGVLQMMDMAASVASEQKPDAIVVAFNSAAIGMPRHWRTVIPSGDGFYNFYRVAEPRTEGLNKMNSLLHEYVITDRLTAEWCEHMKEASDHKDAETLRNDPLVRATIARFHQAESERQRPVMQVDLTTSHVWFLYNRVRFGNPLRDVSLFNENVNPIRPIALRDYAADPRFVASLEALRATGVPWYMIYIPSYPEVKEGRDWASFGLVGVPSDQELELVASLERATDKKILSLLPGLHAPRADAADLAVAADGPNRDWHPSEKGATEFSNVMTDLLMEHHFDREPGQLAASAGAEKTR